MFCNKPIRCERVLVPIPQNAIPLRATVWEPTISAGPIYMALNLPQAVEYAMNCARADVSANRKAKGLP